MSDLLFPTLCGVIERELRVPSDDSDRTLKHLDGKSGVLEKENDILACEALGRVIAEKLTLLEASAFLSRHKALFENHPDAGYFFCQALIDFMETGHEGRKNLISSTPRAFVPYLNKRYFSEANMVGK